MGTFWNTGNPLSFHLNTKNPFFTVNMVDAGTSLPARLMRLSERFKTWHTALCILLELMMLWEGDWFRWSTLSALEMLVKTSVLEHLHLWEQLAAVQSCCSSLAANLMERFGEKTFSKGITCRCVSIHAKIYWMDISCIICLSLYLYLQWFLCAIVVFLHSCAVIHCHMSLCVVLGCVNEGAWHPAPTIPWKPMPNHNFELLVLIKYSIFTCILMYCDVKPSLKRRCQNGFTENGSIQPPEKVLIKTG